MSVETDDKMYSNKSILFRLLLYLSLTDNMKKYFALWYNEYIEGYIKIILVCLFLMWGQLSNMFSSASDRLLL